MARWSRPSWTTKARNADIPPFITTMNARELYGLRPGETVAQAAAALKAMED